MKPPIRAVVLATVLFGTAGPGTRALAQPAGCPQPTKAEIFGALLSIYYRTSVPPEHGPPHAWKPLPLMMATRFLRCDRSFGAGSRRRAAIEQLAAGIALAHGPTPIIEHFTVASFGAALQDLGAPVQQIAERLQPLGTPARAILERETAKVLDQFPAFGGLTYARACCSCLVEPGSCKVFPPDSSPNGIGGVTLRVTVQRGIGEMTTTLDPQGWPTCDSHFEAVYFVNPPPCPEAAPTTDPSPSATPPTKGSTWNGVIFEHVDIDPGTFLKNLLNIDGERTQSVNVDRYRVDYGLCQSLDSQVQGDQIQRPGLLEDCGFAEANKVDVNDTDVQAMKAIKFAPRANGISLDDAVALALKVMAYEMIAVAFCCGGPDGVGACVDCDQTCSFVDDGSSLGTAPLCKTQP